MSTKELIRVRLGIGLNYLSVLLILVIMEYVNRFENIFNPRFTGIISLFALVYWIISSYKIYWKTKWWKYVHQNVDKFDERELKFVGEAMRLSYSFFVVVLASILLIYSLADWSLNGLFVALLIYFAHVLPASILKWQGYQI
ncbi:MAG: hypothetical protein JW729_10120 [Bacteroidales bacterium]|nr:hypothetical protein [Bacteroidales bacterium]